MIYLSNNSFDLLVKKQSNKRCTVMSLSSGRIYYGPVDSVFNSKKGTIRKLTRRDINKIEVEKSIYGMIKNKKHCSKKVSNKNYNEMFKFLKMVDNYETL